MKCNFAITPLNGNYRTLQIFPTHFFLALAISKIYNFQILYLQKVGQGHGVQFSQTPFDGRCQNLQMSPAHFRANSYRFRYIQIKKISPTKSRSKGQSKILAITPFDGKYQNLQTPFLHFWFSLRYALCERLQRTQRRKRTSPWL